MARPHIEAAPSLAAPAPTMEPRPAPGPWRKEEKLPEKRTRFRLIWILAGGVLVAVAALVLPRLFLKPPANIVSASGRIEGREVTLAAKEIQGRVKALLVDEGNTVTKGQLLAELESDQLEARFESLKANIANLEAQITQATLDMGYTVKNTDAALAAAKAAVSSASAHLARARAVLANASVEYQRNLSLYKDGVVSQSVLDQATMSRDTALADVNAAEKDQSQAEANLAVAQAAKDTVQVKAQQIRVLEQSRRAAQAQLAEARANLAERKIYAPTDGTILSRTVEVGDVVSPGTPIFVMVDMSRLYLKVYIPEPDIPKLKLGDPAEIKVDAFPGTTFPARITKIYEQAEFTPKNVETKEERVKLVFGVELSFVNPEPRLKPGMPADSVIHWNSAAVRPK
jgi:multidrug resistance efflux pump